MSKLDLLVTLWPSFPHFSRFCGDTRLSGIRLNSAMISNPELQAELANIKLRSPTVPLWFDAKGRQPRVVGVEAKPDHLELLLNHPISVQTPVPVLFKAGADNALLERVADKGSRLIFHRGPYYEVKEGESIHIRHPSFQIHGPLFTDTEKEKLAKVRKAGFTKYFLSYVEKQRDVDEFGELVGKGTEMWLKIETPKGLQFVEKEFRKRDNLILVAARGDLYVELERPHSIMAALRQIIERDSEACVASRLLLSVIHEPVPSCADFLELAWLYDIGYRKMMLCDELCLKGDLLATAINAFTSFKEAYVPKTASTNGKVGPFAKAAQYIKSKL